MKKIAIPTDNNVSISQDFANAKWFKIIEVENNHVGSFRYIENNLSQSNGQKDLDLVRKLSDCEVIIAREISSKTQEEFQSMNKKIIITNEIQMDVAVDAFIKGITATN
ncbi:MAG: hypothetical protein JXR58_06385 [Bacteroidales bacterium]|nr:hypothetical protein [Bacteroidales bacterium]